ncbi:MAG: right-handed parallel beta-helix repeat-containing protein [Deltaproteobacteria bacterium]|nr:right-handed parallel beta-helix repeat-containing protein [Deltaproteobacteria bacterium]
MTRLRASAISTLLALSAWPGALRAQERTAPGTLRLSSTYECISVFASFSGDLDADNTARLDWRALGSQDWQHGMAMTADRRDQVTGGGQSYPNPYKSQWRASVLGLQTGTGYEIRVRFEDPDGIDGADSITDTIRTRDDSYPAGGVTYYVDVDHPEASDQNAGTDEALPLETIQAAADIAQAGDTVRVKAGTYPGRTFISSSGTDAAYIHFQRFEDDHVILDAASAPDNCGDNYSGQGRKCALLISGSYVRVSGFEIVHGYYGIKVDSPAHDVVIERMLVHDQSTTELEKPVQIGDSYTVQNPVANVTLQDNEIHAAEVDPNDCAVLVMGTSGGHVIRRNRILFDHPGAPGVHGTDCIGGLPNMQIHGGFFENTDVHDNYCEGTTDEGVEIDGGNANVRIWNNVTYRGNVGFSIAAVVVGPAYIFRNVVYGMQDHWVGDCLGVKSGETGTGAAYFYHNTFYLADGSACNGRIWGTADYGGDGAASNVFYRNNIIHAYSRVFSESESDSRPDADYDLVADVDQSDGVFAKWGGAFYEDFESFVSATQQERNGIHDLPAFVDADGADFRLAAGSPGMDRGQVIAGFNDSSSAWPFHGAGPDIGAYESGQDECRDSDGDGYPGYDPMHCARGTDCDDANRDVHPGAEEVCGNEVDEDCDGQAQACGTDGGTDGGGDDGGTGEDAGAADGSGTDGGGDDGGTGEDAGAADGSGTADGGDSAQEDLEGGCGCSAGASGPRRADLWLCLLALGVGCCRRLGEPRRRKRPLC